MSVAGDIVGLSLDKELDTSSGVIIISNNSFGQCGGKVNRWSQLSGRNRCGKARNHLHKGCHGCFICQTNSMKPILKATLNLA